MYGYRGWIPTAIGVRTLAIAELVDLYPTAVALSGLPAVPAVEGLEGISLLPAFLAPQNETSHGKTVAFSQYPVSPRGARSCAQQHNCCIDRQFPFPCVPDGAFPLVPVTNSFVSLPGAQH